MECKGKGCNAIYHIILMFGCSISLMREGNENIYHFLFDSLKRQKLGTLSGKDETPSS